VSARTEAIAQALADGPMTLTELHAALQARGADIDRRTIRSSLRWIPEVRVIDKDGREPTYSLVEDDFSRDRIQPEPVGIIPCRPLDPIAWIVFTSGVLEAA
jgi:hypothetical protein